MTDKTYTLLDLRNFLSVLTVEQLQQPVNISFDDDMVHELSGHEIVEQDIYVNNSDEEDIGTLEELKGFYPEESKDENFMDDYKVATPKGTIFFF